MLKEDVYDSKVEEGLRKVGTKVSNAKFVYKSLEKELCDR